MKTPCKLICLAWAGLLLTSLIVHAAPGAGDPPQISTTTTHIIITMPPDWPHPPTPPPPPTPPATPVKP